MLRQMALVSDSNRTLTAGPRLSPNPNVVYLWFVGTFRPPGPPTVELLKPLASQNFERESG